MRLDAIARGTLSRGKPPAHSWGRRSAGDRPQCTDASPDSAALRQRSAPRSSSSCLPRQSPDARARGALVSVSPTYVKVKGEHAAIRCARRRALAVGRGLRERVTVSRSPASSAVRGGFVLTRIRLLHAAAGARHRQRVRAEGRVRRRDHRALRHSDQPARRQPRPHLLDRRRLTLARRGEGRRPRARHVHQRCAHRVRADRHDRSDVPAAATPADRARRPRRFRHPPSSPTARSPRSTARR